MYLCGYEFVWMIITGLCVVPEKELKKLPKVHQKHTVTHKPLSPVEPSRPLGAFPPFPATTPRKIDIFQLPPSPTTDPSALIPTPSVITEARAVTELLQVKPTTNFFFCQQEHPLAAQVQKEKTMRSATCWWYLLVHLPILVLVVRGLSPEFFFGDGEKKNFSLGFHHYRMGIRRFNSAGHALVEGCKCHRDPVLPEEIICSCRGPGVKDFKANLTRGVTRL
ncbi:hypothetical protein CEXT_222741 [Caerostris extrusa]|uniref:Uncharacterized protein n=1 Tax=Caerostris extrusa TaxID=172846 RepID=A0AAV4XXH7_CAEEX|nr:hypothetical protein CEXT_222741 [Caerostris extrusa]